MSLRLTFDFVLIDSPPAIAVSDAAVLSAATDALILVFHAKRTTTASARQVTERLESVRAPVIGSILNGVNVKDPDYAYYRRYYGSDYADFNDPKCQEEKHHSEDPILEPQSSELETASAGFRPGVVPGEFFEEITSKLRDALGPMAALILRDHIRDLGESLDVFPKNRLDELFENVSAEISNKQLRRDFLNSIVHLRSV